MAENKDNPIIGLALKDLISSGIVPEEGLFDIDENQLYSYSRIYSFYRNRMSKNKGNGKFHYEYARKLAALSLIKLKMKRGGNSNTIKEGFVYFIANPAWPEHIKVGMSIDSRKRLATYQTGDPFRAYRITNYEFVFDRAEIEKKVLSLVSLKLEEGEWIKETKVDDIIRLLRNYVPFGPCR